MIDTKNPLHIETDEWVILDDGRHVRIVDIKHSPQGEILEVEIDHRGAKTLLSYETLIIKYRGRYKATVKGSFSVSIEVEE